MSSSSHRPREDSRLAETFEVELVPLKMDPDRDPEDDLPPPDQRATPHTFTCSPTEITLISNPKVGLAVVGDQLGQPVMYLDQNDEKYELWKRNLIQFQESYQTWWLRWITKMFPLSSPKLVLKGVEYPQAQVYRYWIREVSLH